MEVILRNTTKVITLNGVGARIWEGHTSTGIPVHAFITNIAVRADHDATEFEMIL